MWQQARRFPVWLFSFQVHAKPGIVARCYADEHLDAEAVLTRFFGELRAVCGGKTSTSELSA
jgi:hypothetical protein